MKSTGKIRNPKVEVKTIEPTRDDLFWNLQCDEHGNTFISKEALESMTIKSTLSPNTGFTVGACRYEAKVSFSNEYKEALAVEIEKRTTKLANSFDDYIEMRIKQATEKLTEQISFLQKEVFKLSLNANKTTVSPGFINEAWTGSYNTITPLPINPCSIVKDSNNS